nr:TonB-dependent receptor [uncultured Sulfurimonas sp.]
MKTLLSILTLCSFLIAEVHTLKPIKIETTPLHENQKIISEEKAKETNSISLEQKLQTNTSFNTIIDATGEEAISFRGLNKKNTEYIEDGIPIYRTTGGNVDTKFIINSSKVEINDGSGASSMGVSAIGGEVKLSSKKPTKEFEATLDASISTNAEYYHAYAGTLQDSIYFQTDASYYQTNAYLLSKDFKETNIQDAKKRLNSDKKQKNISFKAGTTLENSLHLATKVSLSRSEYGIAPNVYTDISAPVFEAFGRIDKKDLTSIYLYADYEKNDFIYTFRAYYDEYSDIYALYNDPTYSSKQPLVTYDDSRLGGNFKLLNTQKNYKNSFILQVEENEHLRFGGAMPNAKYILDSAKTSFLNELYLSDLWLLESGLTYTYLKVKEATDATPKDKHSLDAFAKLSLTHDDNSLYASVSKKSRMPSMSEMFSYFPWEIMNEDLKQETSLQYAVGYEQDLRAKTSLNISLYYYDIKDIIILRNNTHINREEAKHYGSEVGISSLYFKKHKLSFFYSYADARDSDDEHLELIADHKIKIEDNFKITNTLNSYISYEYFGSRYSSNTATYSDAQLKLSPYSIVNMQLKYKISKNADTRVGVKNLFDENYQYAYGYPSEGRSFYVTLRMDI